MSRRDTIIIALLVNAGLLALLFMLAIHPEDDMITEHPEIAKTIIENRSQVSVSRTQNPIVLVDTNVHDEVDSFLKDLAAEDAAQALFVDDEGYVELKREAPVAVRQPAKRETSAPREIVSTHDANYVDVTVKRGDALEKIARSNGTSVEAIKKANNLTSAKLSIGQVLRVPISAAAVAEATPVRSAPTPIPVAQPYKEVERKPAAVVASEVQYYVVKSGDNPWNIAKQFNVKFDDLLRLNNLDEERARNMKIGDKIRVK